jgi:hypothetical protein
MTEDQAGELIELAALALAKRNRESLIELAALALAKRNRDGSINNDRVCLMIEALIAEAEIALRD